MPLSVRFGELRVREFDRATMGEHPSAEGGFALQLGRRYRDLPPVAIPNEQQQMRDDFFIDPQQRKALCIELWRFEQELLDSRLFICGGKKQSMDEQRMFERQCRHQTTLLERLCEEHRRKCENEHEWKCEEKRKRRQREIRKSERRVYSKQSLRKLGKHGENENEFAERLARLNSAVFSKRPVWTWNLSDRDESR
jgi:hypothetical protein